MTNLLARQVVSTSTLDKSQAAYLMAKEALRQARENYDLMKSGYRREDIEAARADARQAQAALELAEACAYPTPSLPPPSPGWSWPGPWNPVP